MYLVYRKIDIHEMFEVLKTANFMWIFLGFLIYNASQLLSAKRMLQFLYAIGIKMNYRDNLILYYIGMFYNLFLPGGLGGDGYKVYLLNRMFQKSVKRLVGALLHDRLNGLFGLASLLALMLMLNVPEEFKTHSILIIATIVLAVTGYFAAMRFLFKSFTHAAMPAYFLSLGIQGLQVVTAFCILTGLGLQDQFLLYLQLFLISSIVSVIPITLGGVGARELVYVYGNLLFHIDKNLAVAFTLLFFLTSALSSLIGVLPDTERLKENIKLQPSYISDFQQ